MSCSSLSSLTRPCLLLVCRHWSNRQLNIYISISIWIKRQKENRIDVALSSRSAFCGSFNLASTKKRNFIDIISILCQEKVSLYTDAFLLIYICGFTSYLTLAILLEEAQERAVQQARIAAEREQVSVIYPYMPRLSAYLCDAVEYNIAYLTLADRPLAL